MANPRPRYALTRAISRSFQDASVEVPNVVPIDVPIAQLQHRAYLDALTVLGLTVITLPPDNSHPDGCFVEDCAVYADGAALIPVVGTPSRRGEEPAVAEALKPYAELHWMTEPASLEGGDCMRLGKRIFVGLSSRTNSRGLDHVRAVFGPKGYEVIGVPVEGFLHLKCFCSPIGDDTILLASGTVRPDTFVGCKTVLVPREEAHAANCVAVGNAAIIAQGYPETERALRAAGMSVLPLDTSEIRKADGSLTCLSVLF